MKFLIITSLIMTAMFQTDTITLGNGEKLSVYFLGHASLRMEYAGKVIYIDPVGMFSDYSNAPQADLILVTHHHDDHLDKELVGRLSKAGTRFISTQTVVDAMGRGEAMKNGDATIVGDWIGIEAVPSYNTTPGREIFHPSGGRDNGYVLSVGGTRIYVAGDGEPTQEMKALKNIDIAFLPVNQPYTMTVDQAAEAVKAIKPKVFYPYHYGQTDQGTDIDALVKKLEGSGIEVRVRPME